MADIIRVDFRAPRRRPPPPPDPFAALGAMADAAARAGWATWLAGARAWLCAAWCVLDAAERGGRR